MIKIGLYSFGKCHTVDKYFQIFRVTDIINSDSRFELSIVVDGSGIADEDIITRYFNCNIYDLRKVHINDTGLDAVIIIDPYSRPYNPYREWKIPIIYKEYGVAGCEAGTGYLIDKSVYRYSSLIITDNEFYKRLILSKYPDKSVVVCSPAFDYIFDENFSRNFSYDQNNILWTPHHSVESKGSFDLIEGGLYSTFVRMKDYITGDFLRDRPDVKLFVKYHPILPKRYNAYCKNNGIDDTFNRFVKRVKKSDVGNRVVFCSKSDYYELFSSCGLIINDSLSFLQEWLPTLKPMIVLRNPGNKFSEYGESLISKCYFEASSEQDLDLLVKEERPLSVKSGQLDEFRNLIQVGDIGCKFDYKTNSYQAVEIIYKIVSNER